MSVQEVPQWLATLDAAHAALSEDIRWVDWAICGDGGVHTFCGPSEGVRIGYFQGDRSLASFCVAAHAVARMDVRAAGFGEVARAWLKMTHSAIAGDIRLLDWSFNCAGEIHCQRGSGERIRLGHFQGNIELARFFVEAHQVALSSAALGSIFSESVRA